MFSKLLGRISSAHVIALIALFVAIGGVAGALPGKNTVDSGDIKKNAVQSADISNSKGVKSADVVNDALTGNDINEATLGQVPSAGTVPANSINGTHVQNNSLTGDDIQNGSLGGGDINDGSLASADIDDGSLTGADIAANGSLQAAHLGLIATGSFNLPSIGAGGCVVASFDGIPGADGQDLLLVVPTDNNGTIQEPNYDTSGSLVVMGIPHPGEAHVKVCNVSNGAIDPGPQTYRMLLIEG